MYSEERDKGNIFSNFCVYTLYYSKLDELAKSYGVKDAQELGYLLTDMAILSEDKGMRGVGVGAINSVKLGLYLDNKKLDRLEGITKSNSAISIYELYALTLGKYSLEQNALKEAKKIVKGKINELLK